MVHKEPVLDGLGLPKPLLQTDNISEFKVIIIFTLLANPSQLLSFLMDISILIFFSDSKYFIISTWLNYVFELRVTYHLIDWFNTILN